MGYEFMILFSFAISYGICRKQEDCVMLGGLNLFVLRVLFDLMSMPIVDCCRKFLNFRDLGLKYELQRIPFCV
jgi:hypothetical protein